MKIGILITLTALVLAALVAIPVVASCQPTVSLASELVGDVNDDGRVNVLDMIRVGMVWGLACEDPPFLPEDINQDGLVNVLDMIIIGIFWTG